MLKDVKAVVKGDEAAVLDERVHAPLRLSKLDLGGVEEGAAGGGAVAVHCEEGEFSAWGRERWERER